MEQTGVTKEVFQPFQVTIPEKTRYWEDDDTGVIIKRGQIVTISQRSARSNNLRFALLRNQVLIKEGQYSFAFREDFVKVSPGDNKNLIETTRVNRKTEPEKVVEKVVEKKPVKAKAKPIYDEEIASELNDE